MPEPLPACAAGIRSRSDLDRLFLTSDIEELRLGGQAGGGELAQIPGMDPQARVLSRLAWNRATPFRLETSRLLVVPPAAEHMEDFAAMLSDRDIARMLVNVPHPISADEAIRWIRQRRFTGRAGFQLAILTRDGRLAGSIGISGLSNALVYFLGHYARGKGYAQEVMGPFLDHVHARWRLEKIFAGVFQDNPASRHILERNRFRLTGEASILSPGRDALAPFWTLERGFPPATDLS